LYRIKISGEAEKQLTKLDGSPRGRVAQRIDELAENPRPSGTKKLKGSVDLWRVRVGDYRIIYSVHDDVLLVLVVTIGHRREIYR
jgi:mRNA interferase RelE/StbE